MLYLGHASAQVRQIAEAYGLDVDCVEADGQTLPGGHADTAEIQKHKYVHAVYDLHDFSIDQVLRCFEDHNPMGCHIGTYNPSNGKLITGNNIYALTD